MKKKMIYYIANKLKTSVLFELEFIVLKCLDHQIPYKDN
jgi:hypothetical protein